MKKETIGELLRRSRLAKGLTQDELSKATKIGLRAIQKMEIDEYEPTLRNAGKLALTLGIDVNDLLATKEATVKKVRPRGRPKGT